LLDLVQKQNVEVLPLPSLNFFGFKCYLVNCYYSLCSRCLFDDLSVVKLSHTHSAWQDKAHGTWYCQTTNCSMYFLFLISKLAVDLTHL